MRQASALDRVISSMIGCTPHSLLDVSCGIGTHALGMAARNYQVCAADLSAADITTAYDVLSDAGLQPSIRAIREGLGNIAVYHD